MKRSAQARNRACTGLSAHWDETEPADESAPGWLSAAMSACADWEQAAAVGAFFLLVGMLLPLSFHQGAAWHKKEAPRTPLASEGERGASLWLTYVLRSIEHFFVSGNSERGKIPTPGQGAHAPGMGILRYDGHLASLSSPSE